MSGRTTVGLAPAFASSDWWTRAACAGHDPEWWSDDRTMRPLAVEICLACPVRAACLAEALRTGDKGVVRGGMLILDSRRPRGDRAVDLVCSECRISPVVMDRHHPRPTLRSLRGFERIQRETPSTTCARRPSVNECARGTVGKAGGGTQEAFGMASGTIIRFNQAKGYGFIEQDNGGEDVFLHSEEMRDSGLIAYVGARVSFNILQGVRGLKACDIEFLDVAAHRGDTPRGEQPEPLSTSDFGRVITEALIEVSPSITASQIVEIRQRLINYLCQQGLVG